MKDLLYQNWEEFRAWKKGDATNNTGRSLSSWPWVLFVRAPVCGEIPSDHLDFFLSHPRAPCWSFLSESWGELRNVFPTLIYKWRSDKKTYDVYVYDDKLDARKIEIDSADEEVAGGETTLVAHALRCEVDKSGCKSEAWPGGWSLNTRAPAMGRAVDLAKLSLADRASLCFEFPSLSFLRLLFVVAGSSLTSRFASLPLDPPRLLFFRLLASIRLGLPKKTGAGLLFSCRLASQILAPDCRKSKWHASLSQDCNLRELWSCLVFVFAFRCPPATVCSGTERTPAGPSI